MERRSRFTPHSTGKYIAPTDRDIAIFYAIYKHGPLSSTDIYRLTKHIKVNETYFLKRLGQLYHEDKTEHGGRYLTRPEKFFDYFEARYKDLVYDLTPFAEMALAERGLLHEPYRYVKKNLHHHYMKAHITASLDISCREAGAVFKSRPEIMRGRPLEFPVNTSWDGHPLTRPYMPDDICSITWQGMERYYFIEADRDTERVRGLGKDPFASSSWQRKVVQLKHVIRPAKDQLGIDRPIWVLTVTTNADHMKSMLECVTEVTGGSNYQLVKTYSAFAGAFRVVPPLEDILNGWSRCEGYTQFDLIPNGTITEGVQQEVASAI